MTTDDPYGPPDIPRDRWGRPWIVPPGGGKPVTYTRATTYVGVLEDTFNLSRWQQRMVALGLAQRPDLVLAAAAHHDDKEKLNEICQSAMDAAAAGAAAGVGTALHKLTERLDLGQEIGVVPEAYRADIDAYAKATAGFEVVAVEKFVVQDHLKVGGTPDLVVSYGGELFIADKKTGSIEWGAGKIAMQLAMYARSVFYDHVTKTRTPLGAVNLDRAIVVHLPAGQGRCELKWVDIAAGWEAVALATQVRAWRARRRLIYDFDPVKVLAGSFDVEVIGDVVDLAASIKFCSDVTALESLYRSYRDIWTDDHTRAAKARKTALYQQSLKHAVTAA
jgi:predicted RecB family endonuclease